MPRKCPTVDFRIIAATVFVGVGCAAAAVAVQRTRDPGYWTSVAPVLIPLVLAVGGRIRRNPNPPSIELLDRQTNVLRELVLKQWENQVQLRISAYTLPVPFRAVSEITGPVTIKTEKDGKLHEYDLVRTVTVMDSWAAILNTPHPSAPHIDGEFESIINVFGADGLPSRLVVLGEPGSGKSIMAQSLTVELLKAKTPNQGTDSANTRPRAIPVLMQLATWDPASSLRDWAALQMTRTYPWLAVQIQMERGTSHTLAEWLIDQGRVLMVLDGLDEIARENQLTAFEKLSDAALGGQEMVVTCRTREYAQIVFEAKHPMAKTPAIQLFPLPIEAVRDYLKEIDSGCPPRFAGLLQRVETATDGPLAGALSSPFALWLVATVYRDADKDPSELSTHPSEDSILRHLLNGLISAVYSTRTGGQPGCDRSQVKAAQRRLTKIAQYLGRELNDQNIDWWRLPNVVPDLFIGGLIGSLVGCLLGAAVGLAAATRFSPHAGIGLGITFGIITGILSGTTSARPQEHPRAMDLHFQWDNLRFVGCAAVGAAVGLTTGYADARHGGLIAGLITAAVVGPACAAPCIRTFGWTPGTTAGVTASIALGLSSGLSEGNGQPALSGLAAGVVFAGAGWVFVALFQPSMDKLVVNPRSLLDRDRLGCFVVAVTAGIAFGVVYGIALGPLLGVVALVALTASTSVTVSMWGAFNLSRVWLACKGMLPMRVMGFLDEAYCRGVLRQVGGSYQFRHTELKEALLESAARPASIAENTATEGSAP